jgi:ABC-type polysaccharide/polyol phosphate transport system, ATPase component
MSETMIKIKNLSKEYKMFAGKKDRLLETIFPNVVSRHTTFKALDNLDLEIQKGEVVGILGKNGAGKSTLLKIVTGVVVPTSGNIEVKGKVSSLLELGAAFNPELTGIENIYQHGQVMGLTKEQIEERKEEIIEFADIGEHLYQPVKTYSSGMFARLAFACAINVEPDILIVDEVLSVGDMAFQLKCFKKFEQFKKEGKTILFVSHSVGDILKNCTRSVILKEGKKIYDGNVKDGVEKYKKIMVGLDDSDDTENEEENQAKTLAEVKENKLDIKEKDTTIWKNSFVQNPNITEYGDMRAEVIDYGMFDLKGRPINAFDNDELIILKSKIKFNEDVSDPIFTMTLKDFHGTTYTGTNTDVERVLTGKYKKGDIVIVEFKQKIPITAGKYTLSFSCTKYNLQGDLEVLNRKYDALLVDAITTKDVVGIIRINSEITIHHLENRF